MAQLAALNEDCPYPDPLYCSYLKLWWKMEIIISGINCGIPTYCAFCDFAIAQADAEITFLIKEGIHPSYSGSLTQKLADLVAACAGCEG